MSKRDIAESLVRQVDPERREGLLTRLDDAATDEERRAILADCGIVPGEGLARMVAAEGRELSDEELEQVAGGSWNDCECSVD